MFSRKWGREEEEGVGRGGGTADVNRSESYMISHVCGTLLDHAGESGKEGKKKNTSRHSPIPIRIARLSPSPGLPLFVGEEEEEGRSKRGGGHYFRATYEWK